MDRHREDTHRHPGRRGDCSVRSRAPNAVSDAGTQVMRKIRIVIADDHPIFMRGLLQILSADPELEIVAEARDGETALESIQRHQPDVAILDIDMPKKDGFDVVRELQDRRLTTAVVFLTMHKNEALF